MRHNALTDALDAFETTAMAAKLAVTILDIDTARDLREDLEAASNVLDYHIAWSKDLTPAQRYKATSAAFMHRTWLDKRLALLSRMERGQWKVTIDLHPIIGEPVDAYTVSYWNRRTGAYLGRTGPFGQLDNAIDNAERFFATNQGGAA